MITGGKYSDIAYAFNLEEYVIFDFSRQQADRFPYKLVEDFKNRRVFSTKYESRMKRALRCKLIVFTNWAPDKSMLSADRWNVHHIDLNPLVQPIPVQLINLEGI